MEKKVQMNEFMQQQTAKKVLYGIWHFLKGMKPLWFPTAQADDSPA